MQEANMKKKLLSPSPEHVDSKSSIGRRSNSKLGDQASVFGGPLSMKGGLISEHPKPAPKANDVKLAPLNLNSEIA